MWTSHTERVNERTLKVSIALESVAITYADALERWREDADFRAFFIDVLAASPFQVFRWETPPLKRATATRAFEFVLLDSPGLARAAEMDAFAEHFTQGTEEGVVAFRNLGRDALLVVPCPRAPPASYAHLAAFTRQAPQWQQHALWRLVGEHMQARLSTRPVWLSTAGAGVAWLHVRLDDQPKYYGYSPYRDGN